MEDFLTDCVLAKKKMVSGLYMVAVERQTQNRNNNIKGGLLNSSSSSERSDEGVWILNQAQLLLE